MPEQTTLMQSFRSTIFRSVGRVATHFPRFRGQTRFFLLLFNALGLKTEHVFVDTTLTAPIAYRARLDLHSWLQRIAFLTGEYEADTVSFLLKLHASANRSGYLLDIGANVGLISIPAALLLQARQSGAPSTSPLVISVEAVADNANALRRNVELNGADRLVTVIEAALGDRIGAVEIQVEGDLAQGEGTGTANILPEGSTLDPNGTYECVRVPLQLSTLDALLEAGQLAPACAAIKIDTDGYDLKVLQGGVRFLQESRPTIFGEFSAHCLAWHGQSIDDVVKFAGTMNYLVWQRLPGSRWQFTRETIRSTFVQDLLLIPSEHAGAFAWCCENRGVPDLEI
jgi:FkbM family methyltransferase